MYTNKLKVTNQNSRKNSEPTKEGGYKTLGAIVFYRPMFPSLSEMFHIWPRIEHVLKSENNI